MNKFVGLSLFVSLVGQFSLLANGLGIDFGSHADTTKFPGRVSGVINKILLHKAAGTDGAYVVEVVVPIGAAFATGAGSAGEYRIVMNRDISQASNSVAVAVDQAVTQAKYGVAYSASGFTDHAGLDKLLVFSTAGMATNDGNLNLKTAGFALQIKGETVWETIDALCFTETYAVGTFKVCPEDSTSANKVAADYFDALTGATTPLYVYRDAKASNRVLDGSQGRRLYFEAAAFEELKHSDDVSTSPTFNTLASEQEADKLVQATDTTATAGIDFSSDANNDDFPGRVSGRITKVYAKPSVVTGNNVADKLTGFQVEVLLPKDSVFGTATGNYRVRANLMSSVDNSKVVPIGTLVTQTSQSIDIDNALVADTFYKDPSGLDELFVIKSAVVDLTGLDKYAITLDTTTDSGTTWKHLDSLCFSPSYGKGNIEGFCSVTDTSVGAVEVVSPWVHTIATPDANRLVYRKGTSGRRLSSLRGLYFVAKDFDATLMTSANAKTVKFGAITADQSGTNNTPKPVVEPPAATTAPPATTAAPTTAAPTTASPTTAATTIPTTTTSGATTAVSLSLTGVALTALLALI